MPENTLGNFSGFSSLLTFAPDLLSFSFCLLLRWAEALVLSFDSGPWSFLGVRGPGFKCKLYPLSSCVALGKFLNLSALLCHPP